MFTQEAARGFKGGVARGDSPMDGEEGKVGFRPVPRASDAISVLRVAMSRWRKATLQQ